MTTDTDKPKRGTAALRPAIAADLIHRLLADQRARLDAAEREVVDADHVKVMKIASRVPAAGQETLAKLLAAMGIERPSDDDGGEVIDADQDEEAAPRASGEPFAVMDNTTHDTEPAGTKPYVPGPAASAARSGRR